VRCFSYYRSVESYRLKDFILRMIAGILILALFATIFNPPHSQAAFEAEICSETWESLLAGDYDDHGGVDASEYALEAEEEVEEFELTPKAAQVSTSATETAQPELAEFIPIQPTLSRTVTDWLSLRNAIGDPTVTSIVLGGNITRDSVATTANDLPLISRNLTIDGGGYTLNFNANGTAAVNRAGFKLGRDIVGTFTLSNIVIHRSSTFPMITTALSSTDTGLTHDGRNINTRGWLAIVNDVTSTDGASPLVSLSDGAVTFTGSNVWSMNANLQMINARLVTFEGGAGTFTNANTGAAATIIRSNPADNNAAAPCRITASAGAQILLTTRSADQVVWSNPAGSRVPVFFEVKESALLDIQGFGFGTGTNGATLVAAAPSGGFDIVSGGTLRVHSRAARTGQPAVIQEIPGGTFTVDGAGSLLDLQSWGASNNLGATIRFRAVGNQTFAVSNQAQVTITSHPWSGGNSPAAIRFGTGTGNDFTVNSGAQVRVYNYGNGSFFDSGTGDGYNAAVEYSASDFGYYLDGEMSAVELLATHGPALNAGSNRRGEIYAGPGTIFLASGRTSSNGTNIAALRASGGDCSFEMDSPLYYDFVNTRPGGGSVFALGAGTGNTFTSTNSDVAVWRVGVNPYTGNPDRSWTLISYWLTGAQLRTVSPSSEESFRNYYNSGANNSTRIESYTRISGNNARPVVDKLMDITNADKRVRALGRVSEGLNFEGRPFWDGEVWGTFTVDPSGGGAPYTVTSTGTFASSLVRSHFFENLYQVQTDVTEVNGVLQLRRLDEGFLRAGDVYTITNAWRSEGPGDVKRHEGTSVLPQSAVVRDVTPPLPAGLDQTTIEDWETELTGTWALADAYDNGPVSLTAQIRSSGGGSYTNLPGTGSVNPDGTWSFTIASLGLINAGDAIAIILSDDLGNANPLVYTPYRDALFPAASEVLVREAGTIPYTVRYFFEGTEDSSLRHTGSVTAPSGEVNIGTDFPNKVKIGYKLDSTTPNMPATIDMTTRNINVYYVLDPSQKATVNVEYYFDGVHDPSYDKLIDPQILSTVTIDYPDVWLSVVPNGFVRATPSTDPALPQTAQSLDNQVIKVYYVQTLQELNVSKTVEGEYADKTKEFEFTAYFRDRNSTALPAGTQFSYEGSSIESTASAGGMLTLDNEGKTTFKLSHGQSIRILNVKSGYYVRIVESNDANYTTSFVDSYDSSVVVNALDTDMRSMKNEDRDFSFLNTRKTVVPSRLQVFDDMWYTLLLSALLISNVLIVPLAFRKRTHSDTGAAL